MADSTGEQNPKAAERAERRVTRLAREIGAFGREHGAVEAQIAYMGQRGARIVLVAEDGAWGDLVAPTYAIGQKAVQRSAVTLRDDFDGEMAAKVRTGPYEWSRMAGIQIGGRANT